MADHFARHHQFDCGCKLEVIVEFDLGKIFFGGGSLTYCAQHLANQELVAALQSQISGLEAERDRLKNDVTSLLERERLERARRYALEDNLSSRSSQD